MPAVVVIIFILIVIGHTIRAAIRRAEDRRELERRAAERAAAPPPVTAPPVPRRSWKVDREAVKIACELLEVKVRVEIRPAALEPGVKGRFVEPDVFDERRNPPYVILVSEELAPEDASRTLWHELVHASQRSRMGSGYWGDYDEHARRVEARLANGAPVAPTRLSNPWECEAKAAERFHDELGPLIVPKANVRHVDTPEQKRKRARNARHIAMAMRRMGLDAPRSERAESASSA